MIRLITAGGGSGGHIYPAVHVVNSMISRGIIERNELLWICAERDQDVRILERYHIQKTPIHAGKFRRYMSVRILADFFLFFAGIAECMAIAAAERPRVIFSKGGYVSVPAAFAGWLFRIPVVSHESDILPGLATRLNCRFSSVICIPTEETARYLPKRYHRKLKVTGNPVRFLNDQPPRKQNFREQPYQDQLCRRQKTAKLSGTLNWMLEGKKIGVVNIFITGGSLGSRELNTLIWNIIPELDSRHNFRIFHSLGELEERVPPKLPSYRTAAYVHEEYESILNTADIVISRAGAGSLWEQAWMKKAMILFPLSRKHGSRGEQTVNARWFTEHDAALTVNTAEKDCAAVLLQYIDKLADSREAREMLGKHAYDMIKDKAGETIADELQQYLKGVSE